MSEQAPESVDLNNLSFDELRRAVKLAKQTVQARPNLDGTVDYYSADNPALPVGKTYRGTDGKYCTYLELHFFAGGMVAEAFDTAEAANERLKEALVENGYRIM